MIKKKTADQFLPLTQATYYILIALTEPLHGYGIMQKVEEISSGEVTLGPGTLYGALSKLEKDGVITKLQGDGRRKTYRLSGFGKEIVQLEYQRMTKTIEASRPFVDQIWEVNEDADNKKGV